MISRRALLAGAGLGLLASCRQGSATRNDANTVTFWASFSRDDQRRYFEQHFIDDFGDAHDFSVRMIVKDSSTLERLQQTAIASGQGPDIVFTSGPSYALEYVNARKLAPLDIYAERFRWDRKLQSWALNAGKVGNKLYSIPSSYETMVCFVNAETMDEHGWKAPANRDDFEALCDDAMGQGLIPILAGNADWKPATEWYVSVFFNQYAGPEALHSALTGDTPWTDPVFVDAISLLNDYFQKGWFGGGIKEYFTNRFDTLHTRFAQGEVALDITGSWGFGDMRTYFSGESGAADEDAWDWVRLPTLADGVPEDIFALAVGATYSINADTVDPDKAATYLDWLIEDPRRQGAAVAAIDWQPLPLSYRATDFPEELDERVRRFYADFADTRNLGYVTWTFWPPKSDVFIYEQMDRVIAGKLSPQEYCEGLDEVFREELRDGKVPPIPEPSS